MYNMIVVDDERRIGNLEIRLIDIYGMGPVMEIPAAPRYGQGISPMFSRIVIDESYAVPMVYCANSAEWIGQGKSHRCAPVFSIIGRYASPQVTWLAGGTEDDGEEISGMGKTALNNRQGTKGVGLVPFIIGRLTLE